MGCRCGPKFCFPGGAQCCIFLPGHPHFRWKEGTMLDHVSHPDTAKGWEDHPCPMAYQALCIFWRCHSPAGRTPLSVPLGSLCLRRCSTPLDFSFLLHSCGFWGTGFPALGSTWRLLPKAAFREKKEEKTRNSATPSVFPNAQHIHQKRFTKIHEQHSLPVFLLTFVFCM